MEPNIEVEVLGAAASSSQKRDGARKCQTNTRQKTNSNTNRSRRSHTPSLKRRPPKFQMTPPTIPQLQSVLHSIRLTPGELDFFEVLLAQPQGLKSWRKLQNDKDENNDNEVHPKIEGMEEESARLSWEATRETPSVQTNGSNVPIGILHEIANIDDAWMSWMDPPSRCDQKRRTAPATSQPSPCSSISDCSERERAALGYVIHHDHTIG